MSSLHICPREKFPNFRAEMKELLKILTEKRKVAKIDKSKMTAGQKAAYTRKWRGAQQKALLTAKNAKTFARYKLSQEGYRCISFDSSKGYEYKGVVDLVAVKRDTRNADRLKVLLVQVKGGSARITDHELRRLKDATRCIDVDWNVAHKPAKAIRFKRKIE